MPTPAERLTLLLEVHGDSYRSAAERCGLDHTTLMRVARGETENPATLAKIAEGYGVPVAWMQGTRDLTTDFMFAVLSRPLQERVMFLWQRERRLAFALSFLQAYAPETYTVERLAGLMNLSNSEVCGIMTQAYGSISISQFERLCSQTSLPMDWFRTGLVGREDEEQLLVGLAAKALSSLSDRLGVGLTQDEIYEMAVALV